LYAVDAIATQILMVADITTTRVEILENGLRITEYEEAQGILKTVRVSVSL
jgi:hypothetical protein